MRDLGMVKNDEPVERLFTQGMVIKDGAKMSKSLGNVVSPDDMVARFGADAARLYSLFAAPPDRDLDWQETGIEGIQRFLGRVYRFFVRNAYRRNSYAALPVPAELSSEARAISAQTAPDHQARDRRLSRTLALQHLRRRDDGIGERTYAAEDAIAPNGHPGAVSALKCSATFVLLLAPFAPYLAHELWETLGEKANLLTARWPKYDAALAKEEEIEIPVQVNGKLRSRVTRSADAERSVRHGACTRRRESKSRDRRQADCESHLRARQTASTWSCVSTITETTASLPGILRDLCVLSV